MANVENRKAFILMPTATSKDVVWINWYNELKSEVGRNEAAIIFLKVWEKRGSSDANTRALRKLLDSDGISVDESVFNKAADLGGSISDSLSDVFKTGKVVTFAVIGISIIGLGLFVYNIAKSPDKLLNVIKK
jgi:hypothetical protein